MRTHRSKNRGFTLIESFAAITILTIAVVGPLSLLAKSLADASFIRNRIVATHLAQEGMELVINQKDGNRKDPSLTQPEGWLNGLTDCLDQDGCGLDWRYITVPDCSSTSNNCRLKLDDGKFGYDGASDSIFTRVIQITPVLSEDDVLRSLEESVNTSLSARITVTVTWQDKLTPRTLAISSILTWH